MGTADGAGCLPWAAAPEEATAEAATDRGSGGGPRKRRQTEEATAWTVLTTCTVDGVDGGRRGQWTADGVDGGRCVRRQLRPRNRSGGEWARPSEVRKKLESWIRFGRMKR